MGYDAEYLEPEVLGDKHIIPLTFFKLLEVYWEVSCVRG